MENKETLSKCIEEHPKLRFKDINGKEFPDWIENPLKNISQKITRKNDKLILQNPLTISAEYGLINQDNYFKKIVASDNLENYYVIKNGEFAYNRSYSKEYKYGAIKRLDLYNEGVISTLYICFKIDDNVDSNYLVHFFESDKWNKYAQSVCTEGARNHGLLNISTQDFFNMPIQLPPLPEQQKIDSFLSLLDKKIYKQKELLILLNKYKEGLLSIFFDNIPKEWIDYKLKEISHIKSGEFVIKSKQNSNGRYPVYNGGTTYTGFYDNYNNRGNKIVISARGNAGYVNFVEKDFWAGNSCYVIESKYNIKFLYYQIKYKQNSLYKMQQLATIPSILKKDIEDIDLYIPSIEEQTKIAKILSTYDSLIDKETQILNQLKLMKSGLLQQMFI